MDTKFTNINDLISLAEASKLSGYSQDYLGFLCRTGKLPGVKLGRNWVLPKEDLDAFLSEEGTSVPIGYGFSLAVSDKESVPVSIPVRVITEVPIPEFVLPESVQAELEKNASAANPEIPLLPDFIGLEKVVDSTQFSPTLPLNSQPEYFSELKANPASTIFKHGNELGHDVKSPLGVLSWFGVGFACLVLVFGLFVFDSKQFITWWVGVGRGKLALQVSEFAESLHIPKIYSSGKIFPRGAFSELIQKPEEVVGGEVLAARVTGKQAAPLPIFIEPDEIILNRIIEKQLSNLASIGLLKGTKGDTGPVGPPGSAGLPGFFGGGSIPQYAAPIAVIPANPQTNFNGATLFSATDISAERINAKTATITGDLTVNGNITGSYNPGLTSGSVVFQSSSGFGQDNTNFFWDDTNNALGIGIAAPSATAILDLTSTSKGLLVPRMTTTERDLIASPATGLLVYNTTTDQFNVYSGGAWATISGGGSGVWSSLADPVANLSLNMAEYTSTLGWNTAATSAAFDGITLAVTNDAATDTNTQRVLIVQNSNSTGSTATERLQVLSNADSDEAVTIALEVASAGGGITTAIDVSDSDIGTALSAGANDISGTNWSITGSSGSASFVGVNSGAGLIQGALGLTVTGAVVSLNASSNFSVNIGTGTNNTSVSIGGGANTVAINSSDWDIDATGILTGVSFDANGSGNSITNIETADILDATITGDDIASSIAGAGLVLTAASPDILDVGAGNGITVNANDVALNLDYSPTWTNAHTWTLAGAEDLAITHDLAGDISVLNITATPSGSVGTTNGIVISQADSTNGNGLDRGVLIDNADTNLAITDAIKIINSGGGGYTNLLETMSIDISGAGIISGATGVASSGTIAFSGLSTNGPVYTSGGTGTLNSEANLDVTRGGTGVGTFTANGVLYGSGTSDLGVTAEGSTGQCLVGNTTAPPSWSACSGTVTLQNAYDNGNLVNTSNSRDIDFELADDTTDSNLDIDIFADNTVTISRNDGASAEAPIQLLLVENLDTNLTIGTGILMNVAAGGIITTGIDLADGQIGDALSLGDNGILGTTPDINLTNFDVTGSNGNIVTAGALAVNGDSITADGGTLTINAAGNVDVQDALNADSVTSDAGVSIATGQSYTGAGTVTLSSAAASALTINSGTTGTLAIGDDANNETINFGTGGAVKTITLGSTNSTSATTVQSGSGNIILQAAGSNTTGNVVIGETGGTPDMLVVGIKNTAGNPTAVEGAVYYNADADKFYIAEGGTPAWKEVCNKTDAACGAGSGSAWSALSAPASNLTLAMDADTTTFNWTSTGALNAWTNTLSNTSSSATTQNLFTLNNSQVDTTDTDNSTENILLLQQLDTSTGDSNVVDNFIKIDVAGNAAALDGIEITNSAGNLTNGINIADTSGTLATGILMSGTFTNYIDTPNFDVSNAGAITSVGLNAGAGLIQGILGLTITGASVSLNASSNFDVNVATGTSTGDITLGGGTAGQLISVNSDDWDISTAGSITGVSFDANGSGNSITNIETADILDATITGDDIASSIAGAGLVLTAASPDILDVGSGTGITVGADSISINQSFTPTWTGAHIFQTDVDLQFAAAENLTISNASASSDQIYQSLTIADTNSVDAYQITVIDNTASSGVGRGLVIETGDGSASLDAALAINHTDTGQAMTSGIIITGAASTAVTTAVDVSDAEIGTALSVGANDIVGTTGLINYTNFDVDASGNVTAAGTLNGLTVASGTISSGIWNGTDVGVTEGGTGASTSQSAINNLSQLTTNGDLLYHNGTNSTRLARGANGECLTSNTTTIVWGSCDGAITLQAAYNGGTSIETASNTAVLITETTAATNTGDLLQLTSNTATGGTHSGDLLQLTLDAVDANGYTGHGIHMIIDQSQFNTGNAILVEDDAAALLFQLTENGALTLGAAASETTAITITDTDYTNALSIGDNNIAGTTANIDLTNFDVTGSNGNIVTAGTLAVNGDSITADGATLAINAAGNVDVQDTLNADNITTDTGGVSIAASQSYTGSGAVTLAAASGSALTLAPAGTGDLLFSLSDDWTTTLAAGSRILFDAITADNTENTSATSGVVAIQIDDALADTASGVSQGIYLDFQVTATADVNAMTHRALRIDYTKSEADGADTDQIVSIVNQNDAANGVTDAAISIDNAETTASTLTDAIRITSSGASGGVVDGLDVSDSSITNAINIGDNAIAGTNFSVTGAGAITSVGLNAGAGLIQGILGLTITGASVSLNASSNFDVNVATGTSTGDITLGGGTAGQLISVNSDDWDISTAGSITGVSFDANGSGNSITNIETADILDATITGDDIASSIAGAGLVLTAASPDILDVGAGNGITVNANDVALNLDYSPTWTNAHTWTLAGAENLDISYASAPTDDFVILSNSGQATTTTLVDAAVITFVQGADAAADTNYGINLAVSTTADHASDILDAINITLTNASTAAGTQRGLVITNANDAANATTESLVFLDNAETTANLLTDYILITKAGTGPDTTTDAIDVSDSDLGNALNVGANPVVGTTADLDFSNFDVTGSSGNIVTAGSLAVNGDSITADGATLTINAGGAVDVQDAVTGDSLTADSGAVAASGVIQGGSTSTVAYSRLGTGTTGHSLDASNDLLISDDLEVDGDSFFDGNITVTGTCTGCGGASSLQAAYNGGTSIETASNTAVLITETTAATNTGDLLQLTSNTATGGTHSGDLLQLTLDAVDANGYTGHGIHMIIDQSQFNTGNAILVEDDAAALLFQLTENGALTLGAAASETTAITITDTDYTNALSIGDNNIAMTTGTIGSNSTSAIDFLDFDVDSDGKVGLAPDAAGDAFTITTAAADIQGIVIDASSSDSTQTAGMIQITADTVTNAAILGLALTGVLNDAAADRTVYGNKTTLTVDTDAAQSHTVYGQHITVDNDDASSTVYGLFVDADGDGGGVGTEYAAMFTDGYVGIGPDTTPDRALHVVDNTIARVAKFQSSDTGGAVVEIMRDNGAGSSKAALIDYGTTGDGAWWSVGLDVNAAANSNFEFQSAGTVWVLFENDGDVGIGDITPTEGQVVIGTTDAANKVSLYINTEESTTTQNVFAIETDATVADNIKFKITADGSTYNDANTYGTPADVAEMYYSVNDLEPGDVVVSHPISNTPDGTTYGVRRFDPAIDSRPMGVVSTNPAYTLGYNWHRMDIVEMQKPIALAGHVPVKVSLENGPIQTGDYLVPSDTQPGHVARAVAGGIVVGQALESYQAGVVSVGESTKIEMFVDIGYWSPLVAELLQEPGSPLTANEDMNKLNLGMARAVEDLVVTDTLYVQGNLYVKGVLHAAEIKSEKLATHELCLDDLCISKVQLQALLDNLGSVNAPTESVSSVPGETSQPLETVIEPVTKDTEPTNEDDSLIQQDSDEFKNDEVLPQEQPDIVDNQESLPTEQAQLSPEVSQAEELPTPSLP